MRTITVALALAALQGAAAFTAGGAAPRNLQARAVRMAAKKGGASKASKGKGMSKAEVDAYIAKVKAEVDAVAKARTVDTPAVVASASAAAPAPAPAAPPVPAPAPVPAPPPSGDGYYAGPATPRAWGISDISPDGSLVQRIEGETRKTWKFNNFKRDRVHVALESEGRPITADVQLWLGPDWTPFSLKAYSEDGQKRPINTLVGTRNKEVMIEVQNKGKYEFPIKAASNYASDNMAKVPEEIPATTQGMIIAGNALHSWPIHEVAKQVEVVLHTDGRQLNAKIELLNGPNNPKQVYEVFTNNGDLNRLVVCIQTPEAGNTIRVVNLATVEFPCYANINQVLRGRAGRAGRAGRRG